MISGSLSKIGELALLDEIRARFKKYPKSVIAGIGDDAAVIAQAKGKLLVTTDMMLEGVHFDLELTAPEQLGFKLATVNISDIYAMGGHPSYVLLDIGAPANTKAEFIGGLLSGINDACKLYGICLVGGDVSSSKKGVALSATLVGHAKRPVYRSGARKGDGIYVTGALGDSSCGLELLKKIGRKVDFNKPINKPLSWNITRPLLERHLMPKPKKPGAFIKWATSMIDISDGLFIDLTRLCKESRVGALLYEDCIPISKEMTEAASYLGINPLKLAASGGEDYELLFTAPSGKKVNAIRIGEITASGIKIKDRMGKLKPVGAEGYTHFKN